MEDKEKRRAYLRAYYQQNKEKHNRKPKEQRDADNAKKRERWANDPEYRLRKQEYRRKYQEQRNSRGRERYANDESYRKAVNAYARNHRLRREFGITATEWDQLLAAQGGGCAICRSPFGDSTGKPLAVDHCHETGAVRGLLCFACNFGVGLYKNDPERLRSAADYLDRARRRGVGDLV